MLCCRITPTFPVNNPPPTFFPQPPSSSSACVRKRHVEGQASLRACNRTWRCTARWHGASHSRPSSLRCVRCIMLGDITRSVEQPGPSSSHTVGHAGTAITSQQHHNYANSANSFCKVKKIATTTKSLQKSQKLLYFFFKKRKLKCDNYKPTNAQTTYS